MGTINHFILTKINCNMHSNTVITDRWTRTQNSDELAATFEA
jgi:hypothetical protein